MFLKIWNMLLFNNNKKNVKNKVTYILFYKEQFFYIGILISVTCSLSIFFYYWFGFYVTVVIFIC
jgi:hypothetical protein